MIFKRVEFCIIVHAKRVYSEDMVAKKQSQAKEDVSDFE